MDSKTKIYFEQHFEKILANAELDDYFILTDEAKNRLKILFTLYCSKIPVLIEGSTGTAKTKSVEMLSVALNKYLNYIDKTILNIEKENTELIRFNMSNETTLDDILGRIVSNENSCSGLKFENGPFVDAFKNGKILLFDEVNLASDIILDYIQTALINKEITINLNKEDENSQINIEMNNNFRIFATQNPKSNDYVLSRNELSEKFLSRFVVLKFKELEKKELFEISKKIYEKEKINIINKNELNKNKKQNEYYIDSIENKILKNISSFHFDWMKEI